MPILKNAIKKLRKDVGRTERNKLVRSASRATIKKVRATRTEADLRAAFSAVDRAAKRGVFHTGKADRIKSRLSKLIGKEVAAPVKKAVKKVTAKAGRVSKKK